MTTVSSYWKGIPIQVPDEEVATWKLENAKLCQEIDADCNDCKFFHREQLVKVPGMKRWLGRCSNPEKQPVYPAADGKVWAFPVMWTGNPCFVHRRS